MNRLIVVGSIVTLLAGCVTVPPATLATPEHLQPLASDAERSKAIFVSDLSIKLIDKKIGQMKGGTGCFGGDDLIWRDNPGVMSSMKEQISSTLSRHGYKVYSGLIQSVGARDAEVLLGVGVEDIKANLCYSVNGMKGAASLTLRWEVLDNKTGKSFTTASSGAASIEEFSVTGDPDVFVRAAEMAAENLLAQDAFFKITRK